MLSKVKRLNRGASHPKFKADEILQALSLKPGIILADIGSGGGYYAMRFAEAAGREGRIYAVDTNAESLAYIKNTAELNGMGNIKIVLADEKGLVLPEHSCDLIFLRNVFHHLTDAVEYFKKIKCFLRPDGRVVIIDYKKRIALNIYVLLGHYAEEKVIRKTMEDAGYRMIERYDFLPEQSFTVYQAH